MNCTAEITNDLLVLQNSRMRRRYRWNQGNLLSLETTDLAANRTWGLSGYETDCFFPGEVPSPADAHFETTAVPEGSINHAYLRVDCSCRFGELEVRRCFRLYEDCPAIACELFLRGRTQGVWRSPGHVPGVDEKEVPFVAEIIERLCFDRPHLRARAVQFFDVTDQRNNLVLERPLIPYAHPLYLTGNLLLLTDALDGAGIFILKEAPCSDVQLAYPGCDFVLDRTSVRVVGAGITPQDIAADRWTRCYGFVTGVAAGGEHGLLDALRNYQSRLRRCEAGRDHMIMLNTWGDRSRDARLGEVFALAELEAGAKLGITHFQLDDGWQTGVTSNSADPAGSLHNIWRKPDYWKVNPKRFPRGLAPVAQRARELGIELCLWFNPSADDSYAHWKDDADVLIRLFREHGIRTFKIDGVILPDKKADENFRAMLERVLDATDHQAVFNLDVTAGRRGGYHYLNHYGNLFLENRYTDWGNYYPHWTLRNLWQLARYVPPQNLQIEFLNKWRNPRKYASDDPLAPEHVPFDYCFAITMMAQPLAWFEASNLPPQAFDIAPLVRTYREHQQAIHAGRIFPIGDEPSGASWTGFQSCGEGGGYLLLLRELSSRPTATVDLWQALARSQPLQLVAGSAGAQIDVRADGKSVTAHLPQGFSFALYRYE